MKVRSGLSWKGFGHSTATNAAAWGWWTLGIGVGVGWFVDLPTGAMKNLKDEEIYFDMKPKGTGVTAKKVVQKVVNVVRAPLDVVEDTTNAAMETVVVSTAEQMRITGEEEAMVKQS